MRDVIKVIKVFLLASIFFFVAYSEFEVLWSPVRPFLIAMFWDKRIGNLM